MNKPNYKKGLLRIYLVAAGMWFAFGVSYYYKELLTYAGVEYWSSHATYDRCIAEQSARKESGSETLRDQYTSCPEPDHPFMRQIGVISDQDAISVAKDFGKLFIGLPILLLVVLRVLGVLFGWVAAGFRN